MSRTFVFGLPIKSYPLRRSEPALASGQRNARDRQAKRRKRGESIHLEANAEPTFCSVKALARQVPFIRQHGPCPNLPPLSYLGPGAHVLASDIVAAVRHATAATGLIAQGCTTARVGSHSLRASGATALKLNDVDTDRIKKIGRYSGNTFSYIHSCPNWGTKCGHLRTDEYTDLVPQCGQLILQRQH
jgi:hypothetical protein